MAKTLELEIGTQGYVVERGTCERVVDERDEAPRKLYVGQVVFHRAPVPQGSPNLCGNLSVAYRVRAVSTVDVAGETVTVARATEVIS